MTRPGLGFEHINKIVVQRQESENQYKPRVIRRYKENGYTVTVFAPVYCDGCSCGQWVKPTKWVDSYEL